MKLGSLTVISGPMGSGKTSELLRLIYRAEKAHRKVHVYKPIGDSRQSGLWSRSGLSHLNVFATMDPNDIPELIDAVHHKPEVVFIDEAQFFDASLVDAVKRVRAMGIDVVVSGLNLNFRGEPYGTLPLLLALAGKVIVLDAVCEVCGADASMTQRLVAGKPAKASDPEYLPGGDESYEARCLDCWELG